MAKVMFPVYGVSDPGKTVSSASEKRKLPSGFRTFSCEELGFLQAIHADPKDDAVRLIYADWLEEHGQPERAEFIRLQCLHPAITVRREKSEEWEIGGEDETSMAGKRLLNLVRRYGNGWYRPTPRNRLTSFYMFDRGFPFVSCQFYPNHVIRDAKAA